MIDALRAVFGTSFGRAPEVGARAPGRVSLIGEHTDYNEGLVLPCAIDRDTVALLARREDGRFRLVSREQPGLREFSAEALDARGDWADYGRGVVAALQEGGAPLPGADIGLASDVPLGAGLSSSASLCVALVTVLDAAFGLGLSPRERADRAHRAERQHVGVPCGIMDPWVCALARADAALRIDCRSLETSEIPLPDRLRLLVVHSGVTRSLAKGDYGDRHAECRAAFEHARLADLGGPHATALRDFSASDLPALEAALPPVSFRRARHVILENDRVDRFVAALRADDLAAAGAILSQAMESLRSDFEVSTPELDLLCALGDAAEGVYGSRLSGAGFGGCTLHAVDADAVESVEDALAEGFAARFARRPPIHRVRAAAGASRLPL